MEKKIEFLYNAISDAQELIRFTDTKTAVAITVIAAYVISIFSSIEKIVKFSSFYSIWFWLSLSFCFIFLLLCIIVITRIIKPTNNPVDNINFGEQTVPTLKFFLYPNDYSSGKCYPFSNSKKFKLAEKIDDYLKTLTESSDTSIINSLSLELFKVSYIRNIKNDRFNTLLWLILGLTIAFFLYHFLYSIETQQTISLIKEISHHCDKN